MQKKWMIAGGVAIIVTIGIGWFRIAHRLPSNVCVESGVCVSIEIADTDAERARGLQSRDTLAENTGMLFVFPQPSKPAFWMKHVRFPLDFIGISSDNKVVWLEQNVPVCTEVDCPIYPTDVEISRMLEVSAGFIQQHDVQIGQSLRVY